MTHPISIQNTTKPKGTKGKISLFATRTPASQARATFFGGKNLLLLKREILRVRKKAVVPYSNSKTKNIQKQAHREKERETETERDRDRETERQRDRETERQRDRET